MIQLEVVGAVHSVEGVRGWTRQKLSSMPLWIQ